MNGWILSLLFVWSVGISASIVLVVAQTYRRRYQALREEMDKQVKDHNTRDRMRQRWIAETLKRKGEAE